MVSFSGLGKAFTVYGGKKIQVFNRLSEQIYSDVAGSYCPFTAADLWGTTIDLSSWNGGMNEVLCCTMNGYITPGIWNQLLYRDGVGVFEQNLEAPSGWYCLYWFIGNGELSKNGKYKWEFRNPSSSVIKTYNFTVVNASLEPKGQIVGEPINPPECKVGKTFTLNATMRNIGNIGGYFIFRVFDGVTEIGTGDKTYLSPNTQSGRNITCIMPSHDLSGKVELRRQT